MERNYVKISYQHCGLDYDYTICLWQDLQDNLDLIETEFMDSDPKDFEEYGKPIVTLEPILMNDEDYSEWFKVNVEDNA